MSDSIRFYKTKNNETLLEIDNEEIYIIYRGKLRSMAEIVDIVLEETLKERVDIIPYNNPKRILKHLYGLFKKRIEKKD